MDAVYPAEHGGKRLIPTPQFLNDWFPSVMSGSVSGTPPVAPSSGPATAPTTKSRWGSGKRLGT